jgi:hypothetical protein
VSAILPLTIGLVFIFLTLPARFAAHRTIAVLTLLITRVFLVSLIAALSLVVTALALVASLAPVALTLVATLTLIALIVCHGHLLPASWPARILVVSAESR